MPISPDIISVAPVIPNTSELVPQALKYLATYVAVVLTVQQLILIDRHKREIKEYLEDTFRVDNYL